MITFGTHQILSFQLFKALWHACNTGKWYDENYTPGNLHRCKGKETRSVIRKALSRSQNLWPPVMKMWLTFFFSVALPFPFSLSGFPSSILFFLFLVNSWLHLADQPLSLKPFCAAAKAFSDSWTPTCGLNVWENCISTQEQGSRTSSRGSGLSPCHVLLMWKSNRQIVAAIAYRQWINSLEIVLPAFLHLVLKSGISKNCEQMYLQVFYSHTNPCSATTL